MKISVVKVMLTMLTNESANWVTAINMMMQAYKRGEEVWFFKDAYLVYRNPCPNKESLKIERSAFLDGLVESWESVYLLIRDVLIKNDGKNWHCRVDSGVAEDKIAVVDGNRDKEIKACKDRLYK